MTQVSNSSVGKEENVQSNEFVDRLLQNVSKLDPYKLEDTGIAFNKKIMFLDFTIEANLHNGYLMGGKTLHKTNPCSIEEKHGRLLVSADFQTDALILKYDGTMKLMDIGYTINILSCLDNLEVHVEFSVDSETGSDGKLTNFRVKTVKGIQVSVSGLGPLNWIISKFVSKFVSSFAWFTRKIFEKAIRNKVAQILASYKFPVGENNADESAEPEMEGNKGEYAKATALQNNEVKTESHCELAKSDESKSESQEVVNFSSDKLKLQPEIEKSDEQEAVSSDSLSNLNGSATMYEKGTEHITESSKVNTPDAEKLQRSEFQPLPLAKIISESHQMCELPQARETTMQQTEKSEQEVPPTTNMPSPNEESDAAIFRSVRRVMSLIERSERTSENTVTVIVPNKEARTESFHDKGTPFESQRNDETKSFQQEKLEELDMIESGEATSEAYLNKRTEIASLQEEKQEIISSHSEKFEIFQDENSEKRVLTEVEETETSTFKNGMSYTITSQNEVPAIIITHELPEIVVSQDENLDEETLSCEEENQLSNNNESERDLVNQDSMITNVSIKSESSYIDDSERRYSPFVETVESSDFEQSVTEVYERDSSVNEKVGENSLNNDLETESSGSEGSEKEYSLEQETNDSENESSEVEESRC